MMITRRRQLPALFFCLLLCVFLAPAALADGEASGNTVEALQAAINDNAPSFTLTGDMEIPAGTFINAPSTAVVVPTGTTLTANGIEEFSTLSLTGGNVVVPGGIFRVNEKLERTSNNSTVTKTGSAFALVPAADVLADTGMVTGDEGYDQFNLLFTPTTEAEFSAAVNDINGLNNLNRVFDADLNINCALELKGQHTLRHKTWLRVSGPKGGSLTLAAGSLLQYKDCGGTVFLNSNGEPDKGAAVTVNGNLFINALTVEPGCTFTTAGESIVETGMLTLGGTLVLNGKIFRDNYQFYPYDNGTEVLGTVQVTKGFNLFRAEGNDGILQYIDVNHPVLTYPNGVIETNLCFRPQNENEFTSAVNTANGLANNFVADINIGSGLLLTDEHILTHKTEIRINGNNFGVAENAVLKYDNCGGNMFLSNRANAVVNGELLCNGSVSLEANCSLTVNEGAQLSVGSIVDTGAPITVNGTLLCDGDITMSPSGDSLPSLTFGANGDLMGPCRIYVNNMGESASDCISGIDDLEEGRTNDEHNTVFYSKGGFFDCLEAVCQGFVSSDEVDLRDLGNFEILRNLTVPKTLTLKAPNAAIVVPQGVTLMVNGAIKMTQSVDVLGTMQVQRPFDPEEEVTAFLGCGTLNVSGSMTLAAPAAITTLNLDNTWLTLVDMPYGAATDTPWNTINYTGDVGKVGVKLFHHVHSLTDLADALSKVDANTNAHQEDHIRLFLPDDWIISSNYVIPANANVHVHEGLTVSDGTTLTLYGHLVSEEGQTVTIDGCVALYGDGHLLSGTDGTITVNGSLANNARVTVQRHKSGTGAELIINGGYSGTGNIVVTDASNPDSYISGLDLSRFVKDAQPNWVTYQPRGLIVDLLLPPNLTFLDEQAFAGDTFTSVYIPGSVLWIDPSAFDGMEGLIIYGKADTAAEDFADDHGFYFVICP